MAVNSSFVPRKENFTPPSHINNEIRSHSSVLFNERVHVLFYIIETESIEIHALPKLSSVRKVYSALYQLWKILRTVVYFDNICRYELKLETEHEGVYTLDVGFHSVTKKLNYLVQNNQYATFDNLIKIVYELDQLEVVMRNILQYYKYFVRFDKRQKPDIDIASERYRAMMDQRTMEELKEVLGKNAKIDLENMDKIIDKSYFEESIEEDEELEDED